MASSLAFWDGIASDWDREIRDVGNDYWTYLQKPALERMVAPKAGEHALELATGNGLVARFLAQYGVDVLGTDGSPKMVSLASARTVVGEPSAGSLRFQQLDVSSESEVDAFIAERTAQLAGGADIVTMNMAIMDIEDLQPLAKLLKHLLKPVTGRFVATLLHPFFFTNNATRTVEVDEDANGRRRVVRSIKVKEYLEVAPHKAGLYLPQSSADDVQVVFHRPIHALLAPFFAVGLVVDALEEPNFDESFMDETRPYGSKSFTQIPKILALRLRLPKPA